MRSPEPFGEATSQQLSIRVGTVAAVFGEQGSEIRSAGRFVYVSQGGVWVRVGRHAYCVSKRWGIWLPPAVVCFGYPMMESSVVELASLKPQSISLPSDVVVLKCSDIVDGVFAELTGRERRKMGARNVEMHVAAAIGGAGDIPDVLVVRMPSYGSRLAVVCESVLRNPCKDGQLDKAAAELDVSVRTLGRLFKDELGTSAAKWRRDVQIATAFCALDNGTPVSEVASRLGYRAGAFSTFFRARLGYSPREQQLRRARGGSG